jgi:thiol-disulfide isomerase/thioredoxin
MLIKFLKGFFFLFLFGSGLFSQCMLTRTHQLWFADLELNDSVNLYFNFRMLSGNQKPQMEIYNADETILVDELLNTNDSLGFKMPVFDSELRFKWINRDSVSGFWINNARKDKNRLVFAAKQLPIKPVLTCLCRPFSGKWEVTFNPENKTKTYKAVGIFNDPECWDRIHGTFLTETGDYRYLSGTVYADNGDTTMVLYSFDGSHTFVFMARLKPDGIIDGDFYSGANGHEKWFARRNDQFELRNADSLTFLKPGYDKLTFSFQDLDGKIVSDTDEKYRGKVLIVQIMGSWCPNCMDETKFLSGFYNLYSAQGLEVVALAYERTGDEVKALNNIQRLKKRFNCKYDFLLASVSSDKQATAKTLPELSQIMSFPTTIFIDRKGKVRKISTGFSGPATGLYFEKYAKETSRFVARLLKE